MHKHFAVLMIALVTSAISCGWAQQPVQRTDCVVRHVSDGDSFRCSDGRRVRLIGIDSPEQQQGASGRQSRQALLRLLPAGAVVTLEQDVAPADRYGRVLAYVWAGSTLVNEAMVRGGWAMPYTVPPNVKYAERLRQAQNEARARGTGLWAERGFECAPADFRRGKCVSSP